MQGKGRQGTPEDTFSKMKISNIKKMKRSGIPYTTLGGKRVFPSGRVHDWKFYPCSSI